MKVLTKTTGVSQMMYVKKTSSNYMYNIVILLFYVKCCRFV